MPISTSASPRASRPSTAGASSRPSWPSATSATRRSATSAIWSSPTSRTEEAAKFAKANAFLWTVRCHLHFLTKRPEEKLTFDVQVEIARRLGYTDHAGAAAVERFMKHYFLVAKDVGSLTRIFCAAFEADSLGQPRGWLSRTGRNKIDGFSLEGQRLNIVSEDQFTKDPLDMIRLFAATQRGGYDIHPNALRSL